MEGGDISNGYTPRYLFVWEKVLAHLPPKNAKKAERAAKYHHWSTLLDLWVDDSLMLLKLNDLAYRMNVPIDILTHHPQGFVAPLRAHLEEQGYPFGHLLCHPGALIGFEYVLARRLDVACVFHGETAQPFLFGSKGRLVAGPQDVS